MIANKIHPAIKANLVRYGDALVFGKDAEIRRKLAEHTAVTRFDEVWDKSLEPEIRVASRISYQDARDTVDERFHSFVQPGFQYRQFSIEAAVFVARLESDDSESGICDQLWSIGVHRDPTRLSIRVSKKAKNHPKFVARFSALVKSS